MDPWRETNFDILSHAVFKGMALGFGIVLFMCFCGGASLDWKVLGFGSLVGIGGAYCFAAAGFEKRRFKDFSLQAKVRLPEKPKSDN